MAKRTQVFALLVTAMFTAVLACAQDDHCSPYPSPHEQRCVFSKRVALGIAEIKTKNASTSVLVSVDSDFFDGLQRVRTPSGYEFRKAGQTVNQYPPVLTVVIEPPESSLPAPAWPPAWPPQSAPPPPVNLAPETTPLKVIVKWLDRSHRVTQSQSGDVREVAEPWPERRAPRVWYVSEIVGIKQPLAREIEIGLTGKDNVPLGNLRGGLAYSPVRSRRSQPK